MPHFTTYGGSHFSAGPDVYHPEFQPELNDFEIPHGPHFHGHDPVTGAGPNGFSEVEIHFCTQIGGTSGPGGTSYFTENVSGTSGPGGTTYMTGVDHLGQFGHEADHFTNFAMPVGDFI